MDIEVLDGVIRMQELRTLIVYQVGNSLEFEKLIFGKFWSHTHVIWGHVTISNDETTFKMVAKTII